MERWKEPFANTAFRRSADTAHDLKTPLNIAVLNLELLRMRARKLAGKDDPKLLGYASAIEMELRRMARIFDAFFVNVVPPPDGREPDQIDVDELLRSEAESRNLRITSAGAPALVTAHQARIRDLCRLFLDGVSASFVSESMNIASGIEGGAYRIELRGRPLGEQFENEKVFKFYYTDPSGNPDTSLATVRLILETYGGSIEACQDGDEVRIDISIPLGER